MFFVEKVFEIYELNSTLREEEQGEKPFINIFEELRRRILNKSEWD